MYRFWELDRGTSFHFPGRPQVRYTKLDHTLALRNGHIEVVFRHQAVIVIED